MASGIMGLTSTNFSRSKSYLPADFTPSDYDVICGRGKECYNHIGNRRFRVTIDMFLSKYTQADSKTNKTLIVMTIVDKVRSNCPNGGGFIRFDRKKGAWYEIGDESAREKVGQTIRETLVQQDPEKRAKKRKQRAICKARKMASGNDKQQEQKQRRREEQQKINEAALAQMIVFPPNQEIIQTPPPVSVPEEEEQHQQEAMPSIWLEPLPISMSDIQDENDEMDLMKNVPAPAPLMSTASEDQVKLSDADAVLASIPPELQLESSRTWFNADDVRAFMQEEGHVASNVSVASGDLLSDSEDSDFGDLFNTPIALTGRAAAA